MKLVIFGATGNIGQRIVAEALSRAWDVVGVVRDPPSVTSPDGRVTLVKGDATDATSVEQLARGADAVVSAISPRPNARGLPKPSLAAATKALIAGTKAAGARRLLIVGGAGSLMTPAGMRLMDSAGGTYLSPAAEIQAGARTGKYRTTDETVLTDAAGHSTISFEDYAVAVLDELDELEAPKHVGKRFGVAY